jgi:hypothetical protein
MVIEGRDAMKIPDYIAIGVLGQGKAVGTETPPTALLISSRARRTSGQHLSDQSANHYTPFRAGTIFIADSMTQRGRPYLPPSQNEMTRR